MNSVPKVNLKKVCTIKVSVPHLAKFIGALTVLFAAIMQPTHAQEWRGYPLPTIAAGNAPQSVTTGDFNGDGITDLATANINSDDVSVLLNLGFNDITVPTSTATGPSGSLKQPSAVFDATFTADDSRVGSTGVKSVELFYQRHGGGFVSFGSFPSSPISFDTSPTGGDGSYDFYTVATDNAGNTEPKSPTAETSVTFNNNTSVDDWSVLNDE